MKEIGATFTNKQNLSSQQEKVKRKIRNERVIVFLLSLNVRIEGVQTNGNRPTSSVLHIFTESSGSPPL